MMSNPIPVRDFCRCKLVLNVSMRAPHSTLSLLLLSFSIVTFNAVIDAWARSGCKRGPARAEQILNHMDELYRGGNIDVKPDT